MPSPRPPSALRSPSPSRFSWRATRWVSLALAVTVIVILALPMGQWLGLTTGIGASGTIQPPSKIEKGVTNDYIITIRNIGTVSFIPILHLSWSKSMLSYVSSTDPSCQLLTTLTNAAGVANCFPSDSLAPNQVRSFTVTFHTSDLLSSSFCSSSITPLSAEIFTGKIDSSQHVAFAVSPQVPVVCEPAASSSSSSCPARDPTAICPQVNLYCTNGYAEVVGCPYDSRGCPVAHTCKSSSSIASSCADGVIQAGEGCDDGNTRSGDGCSAACAVESGWRCTGILGSRSVCLRDSTTSSSGLAPTGDLSVTLSTQAKVEQGDSLTVTANVRNQSDSAASNLVLLTSLPANVTFNARESNATCSPQVDNEQNIVCNQGLQNGFSLAAGGSATFVMVFTVNTCLSPFPIVSQLRQNGGTVASKDAYPTVTCTSGTATSSSSSAEFGCASSYSTSPSCIAFCPSSGEGTCRNMCAYLADLPPLGEYLCSQGESLASITCSIYPAETAELQVHTSCEYTCKKD